MIGAVVRNGAADVTLHRSVARGVVVVQQLPGRRPRVVVVAAIAVGRRSPSASPSTDACCSSASPSRGQHADDVIVIVVIAAVRDAVVFSVETSTPHAAVIVGADYDPFWEESVQSIRYPDLQHTHGKGAYIGTYGEKFGKQLSPLGVYTSQRGA